MAYFIFGILFIQYGLPLLEGLTTVILTGLEALKGYFGIQVAQYNNQIRKIADEEDSPKKRPMGFQIEEAENDDE